MDDKALAVRLCDLWKACEDEVLKRYKTDPDSITTKAIFDRADHHIISEEIGKQRKDVRTPKEKEADPMHCYKCGRELTEGEIGFLEGKMDEDRTCYHCSH